MSLGVLLINRLSSDVLSYSVVYSNIPSWVLFMQDIVSRELVFYSCNASLIQATSDGEEIKVNVFSDFSFLLPDTHSLLLFHMNS